MTTFYNEVRDIGQIDWSNPLSSYLRFSMLSNAANGTNVKNLVDGSTYNLPTATYINDGIRGDESISLMSIAPDIYTEDIVYIIDIELGNLDASGGGLTRNIFAATFARAGDGVSLGYLNHYNAAYGGIDATIKLNYNGITNIHTGVYNVRTIAVLWWNVETKTGRIYIDGIEIASYTFTSFSSTLTNFLLQLPKDFSSDTTSALYSANYLTKTGSFTQAEIDSLVADPYQLFQTNQKQQQEYGLKWSADPIDNKIWITGLSGILNVKMKLAADMPLTTKTYIIDGRQASDGGTTSQGNGYWYKLDGNTNPNAVGISNVTLNTVPKTTITGWNEAKKGDVLAFTFDDLHQGTICIGSRYSLSTEGFHDLFLSYVEITDDNGVHLFNFNRVSGSIVPSETSNLVCNLVGFPEDSGYIKGTGGLINGYHIGGTASIDLNTSGAISNDTVTYTDDSVTALPRALQFDGSGYLTFNTAWGHQNATSFVFELDVLVTGGASMIFSKTGANRPQFFFNTLPRGSGYKLSIFRMDSDASLDIAYPRDEVFTLRHELTATDCIVTTPLETVTVSRGTKNYPIDRLGVNTSGGYIFNGEIHGLKLFYESVLTNYWDTTASDHSAGSQPVLIDTVGGNNATGVNMPTDGTAFVPVLKGDIKAVDLTDAQGVKHFDFTTGDPNQIIETLTGNHGTITSANTDKWQPIVPVETYLINSDGLQDYTNLASMFVAKQNPASDVTYNVLVQSDTVESAAYVNNNSLVNLTYYIHSDKPFGSYPKISGSSQIFYDTNQTIILDSVYLDRITFSVASGQSTGFEFYYQNCVCDGGLVMNNQLGSTDRYDKLLIKNTLFKNFKTSIVNGSAEFVDCIAIDCCGMYSGWSQFGIDTNTIVTNCIAIQTPNRYNYGVTNPPDFKNTKGSNNISSDDSAVTNGIGTQDANLATYFTDSANGDYTINTTGQTALAGQGWNGTDIVSWAYAANVPQTLFTVYSDLEFKAQIKALATSDLELKSKVLAKLTSDLDVKQAILVALNSDLELKNAINASALVDLELRHSIKAQTTTDLNLKHTIYGKVANSLEFKQGILARQISDLEVKQQLLALVSNDVELRNQVLAKVTTDIELKTRILSTLFKVVSDLELKNKILAQVVSDAELKHQILARNFQDLELKNAVLAQTTQDLDLKHQLLANQNSELELQTSILSFAKRDLTLQTKILSYVASDLTLQTGILAKTFNTLELQVAVQGAVVKPVPNAPFSLQVADPNFSGEVISPVFTGEVKNLMFEVDLVTNSNSF